MLRSGKRNKIQPIDFHSVEDLLAWLPEEERQLVEALRRLVHSCLPDGREALAYHVPFFYRHARICYIWPSSVPWGVLRQGVQFGFCKGALLADEIHYLNKDNKKQVATRLFSQVSDIDADLLKAYLYEAIDLDEQAASARRAQRRQGRQQDAF
jgi:hypothetical protein